MIMDLAVCNISGLTVYPQLPTVNVSHRLTIWNGDIS